ncbi:hypothetical protein FJQ98_03070 [Lysinibacillus agricola]|uniref:Uncharacterized protein n=1 Tax=Lysinibacillus agricola TaxID=2590012 RepID=A0ABX7ATD9_9BACI|nr:MULTISPECIES: hypothetical protein [Lysinibacillus]QQP13071.1 hypothetical protein FJQ98_03070 [Lysinibacillus agricola]
MKEQKQITMYDFIEQPIKKLSTDVNKAVDKKNVIVPRVVGYIVRR